MSFKQYFTEALDDKVDYDSLTFTYKGSAWMSDISGDITPDKQHTASTKIYCFLDNKNGTWWAKADPYGVWNEPSTDKRYRIIQSPRWYSREVGGYKRSVERHAFQKKLEVDIIPKLVRYHEAGLTPDQSSTALKI